MILLLRSMSFQLSPSTAHLSSFPFALPDRSIACLFLSVQVAAFEKDMPRSIMAILCDKDMDLCKAAAATNYFKDGWDGLKAWLLEKGPAEVKSHLAAFREANFCKLTTLNPTVPNFPALAARLVQERAPFQQPADEGAAAAAADSAEGESSRAAAARIATARLVQEPFQQPADEGAAATAAAAPGSAEEESARAAAATIAAAAIAAAAGGASRAAGEPQD